VPGRITTGDIVPTVALIGTLDTKGEQYRFLKRRLEVLGCGVVLVDVGVIGEPLLPPDVSRFEVAAAAGVDLEALVALGPRGSVVAAMGRGAARILGEMVLTRRIDAVAGMGGSGGTSLIAGALQGTPIGFPKLIVSTMASGDTRAFVGGSDITLMYSVVDLSGLNSILKRVLGNAASAIAGMAQAHATLNHAEQPGPVIGATMFGVTTAGVTTARTWLEDHGYEVLVFHATGSGGRSMEALMRQGLITGVLDATTTELVDELVGGVLSAGPKRLETAGELGLPQVISLGSLDIANFGPIDTVPERFRDRNLYIHNPAITLMRTTPDECARLGEILAGKVNRATGPVAVFLPLRGTSAIAVAGGVFHDPVADEALFRSVRANLDPSIELVEMDTDINDPECAIAMAECVDRLYRERQRIGTNGERAQTQTGGRRSSEQREAGSEHPNPIPSDRHSVPST
jgi:uncharacterized protein (UPF0261 family)